MVGTEAHLLRQEVEREVLAQMRANVVRHPRHLAARQHLYRRPYVSGCGRVVAQQVHGQHLGCRLRIQSSGRSALLQFAPQREANLGQHGVLKAGALDQGQACGIIVRHLRGLARQKAPLADLCSNADGASV